MSDQKQMGTLPQSCIEKNCNEEGRICIPDTNLPRIVIVGGGFAGLNLVKRLWKKPVQVVLIDKNNFHQFTPLLYQVAASGLEPDSIIFPFRKLFNRYDNVVFRMAEVTGIDLDNKKLNTLIGSVYFDYLVLAGGSDTNFYGNHGFEDRSLGLKSITNALDIRSKILQNLEKATVTCIKKEKEALSNIVIVGGGPAGVEIAGALAEFKRYIVPKDYPELKDIKMKIYLVESTDRLLQILPERLSKKTHHYLKELKVIVLLNTIVKSFDGSKVQLDNGVSLNTFSVIWTAGVKGINIKGLPSKALDKNNRIKVDTVSRVNSLNNVFAIGDIACMETELYPSGHPMVAQVAIQQGKTLAYNLLNMIQKKPLTKFEYHDKGSMATIGKKRAVATINNLDFGGFLAWLIWSFIHLISIMGVRNKILVAFNWLWSYFNYDKGDRVIIRKYKEGMMKEDKIKD